MKIVQCDQHYGYIEAFKTEGREAVVFLPDTVLSSFNPKVKMGFTKFYVNC